MCCLAFAWFFTKFQPGVAYKSAAYKKAFIWRWYLSKLNVRRKQHISWILKLVLKLLINKINKGSISLFLIAVHRPQSLRTGFPLESNPPSVECNRGKRYFISQWYCFEVLCWKLSLKLQISMGRFRGCVQICFAYSEPYQTSKMELLAKIFYGRNNSCSVFIEAAVRRCSWK